MKRLLQLLCLFSALRFLTTDTHAIVDTNANGLSDLWEKAHNSGQLFSETYDPQADPDQDGWTNAQEAAAGTDPNNANALNGVIAPGIDHIPAVMGEENGQPVVISPEVVTVSWPTLVGKRYALHFSPDLSSGSWLEVPQSDFIGDGNIHEFNFETSGGEKCFWRVAITDVDSDNDGLTDTEEHTLNTDPQDSDSDDDNLADGEEITIGTDPNGQFSDEDDLPDGIDAVPGDTLVDWERTSEGLYALMDIPVPADQTPRDINDNGDILFDTGIWMDGGWQELLAPEMSGGFAREQNEEGNTSYESLPTGWTAFNNDRQLVGTSECSAMFTPDPGSTQGGGESTFYSAISWADISQPQYCEELAVHLPAAMRGGSFDPLGIATDGRKAAVVSYVEDMNPDPEIDDLKSRTKLVILSPDGGDPEFLTPPDDYLIYNNHSSDRRVTASGWIICPSYKTTTPDPEGEPVTSRRIDVWKPDNTRINVSGNFPNVDLQRLNLTELPNGRIGIAGGAEDNSGSRVLLEDTGHSLADSTSLSGKGIQTMAGDGSGITRDHQLWRNGKLTPMRELCKRYGELLDDGWQLIPLKANKHGTYLIQAEGPAGQKATKLAVKVEILDAAKKPVKELRVTDMEKSLTEQGDFILDSGVKAGVDGDLDRFYIRIPGLFGNHSASLQLSTVDNADSSYNDDATEITLYSQGEAGYESKSQALVSGAVDAEIATLENVVPGTPEPVSKHKRTHNIQLGGNVRLANLLIDGASAALDSKIPVPIKETVKLNFVVVSDSNAPDITSELKITNEIFASTGIRIEAAAATVQKPPLKTAQDDDDPESILDEQDPITYQRYVSNYGSTIEHKDIHVFYVKSCSGRQGFSTPEFLFASEANSPNPNLDHANNLFIANLHSPFTLAHELFHVLSNANHYGDANTAGNTHNYSENAGIPEGMHNLMSSVTRSSSETDRIGAKKRLYEEQRIMALSHWFKK